MEKKKPVLLIILANKISYLSHLQKLHSYVYFPSHKEKCRNLANVFKIYPFRGILIRTRRKSCPHISWCTLSFTLQYPFLLWSALALDYCISHELEKIYQDNQANQVYLVNQVNQVNQEQQGILSGLSARLPILGGAISNRFWSCNRCGAAYI